MNHSPIVLLLGPTASGKTQLAATLFDRFPIALISVDSAQVYRGMNIGTAKPDRAFLARYPHALIDICEVDEIYSAAHFVHDAQIAIENARKEGKIPLLVGGSMLYFHALFSGMTTLPSADPNVRQHYQSIIDKEGTRPLYERLQTIDPVQARKISMNDTQRIIRLNELYDLTQTSPSTLFATAQKERPYKHICAFALLPERAQLHQNIEQRLHEMMDGGFLDEVKQLKTRPEIHEDLPAMKSAGYRQLWQYLEGKYDFNQAVEQAIIATRQLAKRQITWMNNKLSDTLPLQFFNPQTEREKLLESFASFYKRL